MYELGYMARGVVVAKGVSLAYGYSSIELTGFD
jgi:hypothetical protein